MQPCPKCHCPIDYFEPTDRATAHGRKIVVAQPCRCELYAGEDDFGYMPAILRISIRILDWNKLVALTRKVD